ncbi:VPLPA-CTERM sorting domain-containing protein [Rhodobacteraceae bacterium SC52]|nr:VPLPA-CTERM sorting domain-containing protein [Rhodobacteraceae bacterium SC52]
MKRAILVIPFLFASAAQAVVVSDNSIVGDTVNDFNSLASGSVAGTISQTGATYGEAFAGQTVSTATFDTLTGTPTAPLTLTSAATTANNIGIYTSGSQTIYGDVSNQIGEGALSILFSTVTDVFGLEVVGANSGTFTVAFFDTVGSLLDSITQTATNGFFGFRSSSADIAGVSITNDDPAGLAYDNVTFNSNVSSVPLPAALPLMVAGLGALAFARRRAVK